MYLLFSLMAIIKIMGICVLKVKTIQQYPSNPPKTSLKCN